ncbi:Smr/MutS family protein [candidate division WOR-3 bacterium]|nr:Smr/MutS family protein [candidate division WOR-3 bacterium]
MKKIAQTVGLTRLKEIVAEYADSNPGKLRILSLQPTEVNHTTKHIFKQLSQVLDNQDVIPEFTILENRGPPGISNILSASELLYFSKILNLTGETRTALEENKILEDLVLNLDALPELNEEILRVIDEDGEIKNDASPVLKSLYRERAKIQTTIDNTLKNIMQEHSDILQDDVITKRLDRTVIPIKYDRKGEIGGAVVNLSRTGNTAFIEPVELLPLNNQLRENTIDIEEEKKRILKALTDRTREQFDVIAGNIGTLTGIDSLRARARYARDFKCSIPRFSEKSILNLKQCRHPLLMKEREVVPLDMELDEKDRILIVSGPNAGGKTVLLKTIGLTVLSAYAGLPTPTLEGTIIGTFKDIYGIIEDEQSIEENLSSFSSYMIRLKKILEEAEDDSLILCDELGGNTDPEEGAALAISVLDALRMRGSLVVATTHLGTLKFYVAEHEGMQNGAMEYVDGPTYHLQLGIPGGSRAIAVAESLGLPKQVIEKAKGFLDTSILKVEDLIEELSRRNKKIRQHEKEIQELKLRLDKLTREYNEKIKNIKSEEKKIIGEAKESAKEIVKNARSTVETVIKEIKERNASRESIKQYKNTFESMLPEEKEEKERLIYPKGSSFPINFDVDMEIPLEISVRGMTKVEAWDKIDEYLDRAVLAGYESVRILHGKGSWILRNTIHDRLKKDSRVKSISIPPRSEGGAGVTIAKL